MEGIRREMRHLPGHIDCVFFHVPQSSVAIDLDDLPVVKLKFSAQISRDQGRNRHILIIYRIVAIGTARIKTGHIDDIGGSRGAQVSVPVRLIPAGNIGDTDLQRDALDLQKNNALGVGMIYISC